MRDSDVVVGSHGVRALRGACFCAVRDRASVKSASAAAVATRVRGCRKVFGKSIGKVLPEVDLVFGRAAECGVEE